MSEQLSAIHHLAMHVSDVAKAVKWYQTSFTCEVVYSDKTQTVLQFANIRLALVLPNTDPPHLAFERADAGTFGELRTRVDGLRSTFVADSTGNLVEIIQAPYPNEPTT